MALTETGLDGRLEVDKVRQYFDHPGFVEPFVEGTAAGLADVRAQLAAAGTPDAPIQILFATHSIPTRDADAAGRSEGEPREFEEGSAYVAQHLASAAAVIRRVEEESGPPLPGRWCTSPAPAPRTCRGWNRTSTTPSRNSPARASRASSLFRWASSATTWKLSGTWTPRPWRPARNLGLAATRVPTPGTHRKFVNGMVDLICERTGTSNISDRPAVTGLGPWYDVCRPGCCANFRGEKPTIAAADTTVGTGHDPYPDTAAGRPGERRSSDRPDRNPRQQARADPDAADRGPACRRRRIPRGTGAHQDRRRRPDRVAVADGRHRRFRRRPARRPAAQRVRRCRPLAEGPAHRRCRGPEPGGNAAPR